MQQQPQMIPVMPSFPPSNITTEQIQKYLDENKKLILAILENQNLGKIAECSQYQALLQKNLMYLAAIADAQPPTPTMPPQMSPHNAMPIPPGYFMQQQHPQMAQPPGGFPQKSPSQPPMQFNSPHQLQDPHHHQQLQQQHHHHHHQQQQQLGMRNNGMHPMHSDATLGGVMAGGSGVGPSSVIGNKHDVSDNADGQGNSGGGGDGADEAK